MLGTMYVVRDMIIPQSKDESRSRSRSRSRG